MPAPTEREKTQWYFPRYVAHLPAAGEIVLLDRSWYNRAGVERVMGFCTEAEYLGFLRSCPEFERMLVRSGIILVKYWFSVSDEEQERRFQDRLTDPARRWKLSPVDLESRGRWVEYSRASRSPRSIGENTPALPSATRTLFPSITSEVAIPAVYGFSHRTSQASISASAGVVIWWPACSSRISRTRSPAPAA